MHRSRTKPSSAETFKNVDLICYSHLRWGFVYQRPQHLMSRFAQARRVFFFEEPVYESGEPSLRVSVCAQTGVHVVVPCLPHTLSTEQRNKELKGLLDKLIEEYKIQEHAAWFYTPMALAFSQELSPVVTIYDCMDELSLFHGAPPELVAYEKKLFEQADLVFTGGLSLFEAKCEQHPKVFAFPSSVDVPHFAQARALDEDPQDQKAISHPRIGYAGVIDERLDLHLLAEIAHKRPDWHLVMIGPVVKISPESLPQARNIHYLGMKPYAELPAYFACWDAAMLPFALNHATRFISPTKTPEYLAAGLPVISTPIKDVIRPYGELGLSYIVSNSEEFASALDRIVTYGVSSKWRERADAFLSTLSWDSTWEEMNELILTAMAERKDEAIVPVGAGSIRVVAKEAFGV